MKIDEVGNLLRQKEKKEVLIKLHLTLENTQPIASYAVRVSFTLS